jgi:hypothetical protein
MADMKDLPSLSFVSPRELLAEKFHMSQALISALNPEKFLQARVSALRWSSWTRQS